MNGKTADTRKRAKVQYVVREFIHSRKGKEQKNTKPENNDDTNDQDDDDSYSGNL
jgi:hypothetical protein